MKLSRTLLLSLAVVAIAPSPSSQAEQPSLQLRREGGGVLRLSMTGDTNRAVLEQTDSLWPISNWSSGQITSDGVVPNQVPIRIFRLRLIPGPPPPASAAKLGALTFKEAPPQVKEGERIQFEVVGQATTAVDAHWFVNGIAGGSASVGFIDAFGVFTAPTVPSSPFAEIRAEVVSANGDRSFAQMIVEIAPPASIDPTRPILAAVGGEVQSIDGQSSLVIPPGALKQDLVLSIAPGSPEQLEAFNANDDADSDVVALAVLGPDGSIFNTPLTVKMHLDRWLKPGTKLPIEILGQDSIWRSAGMEGEVDQDGLTVSFQTPHFSTVRAMLVRGPILSLGPTVTGVLPAEMLEGELRPILLRGLNFAGSMRVTAHPNANLGPAPLLKIISKAFDPTAPHEFGVLIKALPDPALASGFVKNYTLRLSPLRGSATTVTITVRGLDELVVSPAQTLDLSAGPTPPASRLLFSKIEVGIGATLLSHSTLLAWQATDSVDIQGQIMARGRDGVDGALGTGGVPTPGVEAGGSGGTISTAPGDGDPIVVPDFSQFLPGSLDALLGLQGSNGYDAGAGNYQDSLAAVSEQMSRLYTDQVNSRTRDPFDFNFWHRLADELTGFHPEGRKGRQGHPGGFIPRPPRSGFYVGSRRVERGGGGGGGGASFRANSIDPNSGNLRIGLGGGSGGSGGGAISFVAGSELIVGPAGSVDTSGGDGGNGALPTAGDFPNPASLGRGAGGGPGGAGTIHLLAGERLSGGNGPPFSNSAGAWGSGGFLMLVGTHRQATPRSWLEPMEGTPMRSQAEVAGPDFANNAHSLQTRIQTARAVEAAARNPYEQAADVTVSNSQGARTFRLVGRTAGQRRVRILLKPGTNHVVIASSPDHGVLNREVLVLTTPDTDGDGLSDEEEQRLGFDPLVADTDHDGINDSEEWLAGGAAVPGDSDGDGFPDAVEVAFGSDPNDPDGTPFNTNLGSGVNRGLVVADPQIIVNRPAFGAAHGVPPNLVLAVPPNIRVTRPAIGPASGIPLNIIFAQPQSIVVHP